MRGNRAFLAQKATKDRQNFSRVRLRVDHRRHFRPAGKPKNQRAASPRQTRLPHRQHRHHEVVAVSNKPTTSTTLRLIYPDIQAGCQSHRAKSRTIPTVYPAQRLKEAFQRIQPAGHDATSPPPHPNPDPDMPQKAPGRPSPRFPVGTSVVPTRGPRPRQMPVSGLVEGAF